jgi:two-component system chemotaxis sensor kinase CheA
MRDGMPLDEMGDYLRLYIEETEEQLDALVQTLLALEQEPHDKRQLNESFRLIHSIKGSSALLGLDRVTTLTHHLESHFERLRAGTRVLDAATMGVVLRCIDFLRECNGRLKIGEPLDQPGDLLERVKSLEHSAGLEAAAVATPRSITTGDGPAEPAAGAGMQAVSPTDDSPARPPATAARPGESEGERSAIARDPGGAPEWRIRLRLRAGMPMPEMKAELLFARLASLGSVTGSIPSRESLAAGADGLERLEILIATPFDAEALGAACDADGVEVEFVEPAEENAAEGASAGGSAREPQGSGEPAPPTSNEEAGQPSATRPAGGGAGPVAETVRVDVDRLDVLLNLTGELVVSRARLAQIAADIAPTFRKSGMAGRSATDSVRDLLRACDAAEAPSAGLWRELEEHLAVLENQARALEEGRQRFGELVAAIDQLTRVSDSLQRGVLKTRMVPIGPLFSRFRRSVRDIAGELGKKVVLEVVGEKTELDKRMIDEIGDPLNHLIRNSIDHGIEPADVRRRRGKPEAATVRLTAMHRGSNVFITVEDDGGGIDTTRVRQIAIDRGLLAQDVAESLGENEVIDLIWEPGFSTAASISDISGRGVGMDIVRTRIGGLNGSIDVATTAGAGTVFTIRLPLTLTITRCMLFRLPEGVFAVPIENVREIVAAAGHRVVGVNGRQLVDVRGEFLPLVGIHDLFDWHGGERADGGGNVVLLHAGGRVIGLRVDSLLGGQDLVVKPFDENFVPIRGLGGASILGDGTVCLLLDVAACIELSERGRQDRPSTGAT